MCTKDASRPGGACGAASDRTLLESARRAISSIEMAPLSRRGRWLSSKLVRVLATILVLSHDRVSSSLASLPTPCHSTASGSIPSALSPDALSRHRA